MRMRNIAQCGELTNTCGDGPLGCPSLGEARRHRHDTRAFSEQRTAAPSNKPPPTRAAVLPLLRGSTIHGAHRTELAPDCRSARISLRRAKPATYPYGE